MAKILDFSLPLASLRNRDVFASLAVTKDASAGVDWHSENDDKTCPDCAALDGQHFDRADDVPSFPHLHCRCTLVDSANGDVTSPANAGVPSGNAPVVPQRKKVTTAEKARRIAELKKNLQKLANDYQYDRVMTERKKNAQLPVTPAQVLAQKRAKVAEIRAKNIRTYGSIADQIDKQEIGDRARSVRLLPRALRVHS